MQRAEVIRLWVQLFRYSIQKWQSNSGQVVHPKFKIYPLYLQWQDESIVCRQRNWSRSRMQIVEECGRRYKAQSLDLAKTTVANHWYKGYSRSGFSKWDHLLKSSTYILFLFFFFWVWEFFFYCSGFGGPGYCFFWEDTNRSCPLTPKKENRIWQIHKAVL